MKYINADIVLPEDLLKEVQKYIHGGMLYVPKPEGLRARWGENSGGRAYLTQRNNEIRKQYRAGLAIEHLADQFCLSCDSIKKIAYGKK